MSDPDEDQLSKLSKRMLATPPKRREDSKFGKPNGKPPKKRGGLPKKTEAK